MPNIHKQHPEIKNIIQLAVMCFFMFGFGRLVPPFAQITPEGMNVLGCFIGCIFGCVFMDMAVTSLLGIISLVLSDATTASQLFANGFGSDTAMVMIAALFVSAAIGELNVDQYILSLLMNIRFAANRPWVKIYLLLLCCFLISALAISLAAVIMFIPIVNKMLEQAEIKDKAKLYAVMYCGLAISSALGSVCLPFKPLFLICTGLLHTAGYTFNIGSYIAVVPFMFVLLAIYTFLFKLLHIDTGTLDKLSASTFTGTEKKVKLSARQIVFIGILIVWVILMVIPDFLPESWPPVIVLHKLGTGGLALAVFVTMLLVKIKREPIIDIQKLAGKYQWNILFLLAFFLPLATLLTADVCGIKASLAAFVTPLVSNLSSYVLVLALTLLAAICTNFLSNTACATIFTSLAIMMGDVLSGMNMYVVMILILICCNIACATPAASAPAAVLFSQRGKVTFRHMVIYGFISVLVIWFLGNIFGLCYFHFIFD